jgi:glycerol-3-phosphate dehydrogenase (NAD(P)+)
LKLLPDKIATLSGPSHAEEVVRDLPTTVVVAGEPEAFVYSLQEIFSSQFFRVYFCSDLVGVELGGALKNIIAIASGIADGLGMGDNTRGALITRGLAEITRLGLAMGAQTQTFAGLSGIGDLVTTCSSRHSRNRHVGERLGLGEKLADILNDMSMVAEGVQTTKSGYELARNFNVEMPITTEVYRVLFEDKPARQAVEELMGRKLKSEVWR